MLFLRTPLLQAVGAIPTLLSAQVAFNQLRSLELAEYETGFEVNRIKSSWQTLEFREVHFQYPQTDDKPGFDVGPISLTIHNGEQLFLIGGNGSGKSTFAKLLTGLYTPSSGSVLLDGAMIDIANRQAYRQLFSSVFTDFHLFDELLGPKGEQADPALVEIWLNHLNMKEKLNFDGERITNIQLSQGQKSVWHCCWRLLRNGILSCLMSGLPIRILNSGVFSIMNY